jgi:hypothetical protein
MSWTRFRRAAAHRSGGSRGAVLERRRLAAVNVTASSAPHAPHRGSHEPQRRPALQR